MQATRRLCERIAAIGWESLDGATVARVKEAIGDGLSVAMAGAAQKPVVLLAEYVRGLGCAPRASVWGHGLGTSAAHAALVNAASMHVLDYEPMSSPSTHAVSPVLPAVMAVAEARGLDGRQIVTACAKGFEVQHRLLFAATEVPRPQRRFHPPGVVGVVGATVAVGHLLELDAQRLARAIGIAASRSGALLGNAGTMTKCTHAGYAASGGLEAAELAARGYTANEGILEHPQGLVAAFLNAPSFGWDRLLSYGEPFRIVDPGMAFKFFPSKYPTQFVITAGIELHARIGVQSIRAVRVTVPEMADVDRPQPASGLEGKFSFQYTAAAALLDGDVGIASFADERRFRDDMVALLPRIELVRNAAIPTGFNRMWVEMEVETEGGERFRTECRKPKGFWGVPIAPEEHAKKMRDCMSGALHAAQIDTCSRMVTQLDCLDARGVADLVGLLAGSTVPSAAH